MATKKKTSKRPKKAKKTASKKSTPKNLVKRQKAVRRPKKAAKKKSAPKKAVKWKASPKKPIRGKTASLDPRVSGFDFRSRSEQSGDLQGLSHRESADSESVDELLEEGNAFEADVLTGVERAGDRGEREVHTHEVPEDDVPGEYLDEE